MNPDLNSYTQRRSRIAAILEPYLHVSRLANTTADPNPLEEDDGLACKWGDPETGLSVASVFIRSLSDVAAAVARHRNHVDNYQLRFEDSYLPASAREEASNRDGEYIFIFEYVDDISVIVGQCQVSIVTGGRIASVSDLVEPALEIGRTVGCSPYENDFVPPEIPDRWRQITWGSPPFPPFRPPPPQ
jgi:hypothetical protein